MFEKYMICTRDFGNVSSDGQVTGFQVKIRINYYRGCYLSMEVAEFPKRRQTNA